MSRDHWDAILASAPLNATAGKVTGKGEALKPATAFHETVWDAPPPMVRIGPAHFNNRSFADLTGLRVGRLLVIGVAAEGNRWVCRCACGSYVGRRAGPLKTGKTTMCDACNYTEKLRWQASGANARQRAEAPEARKWKTTEEVAAEKDRAA
jgi:hypothetical protein